MNTGEKIKFYRNRLRMTQEELAQKANISRVAIGNYERGDRIPNIEIANSIAGALEIPLQNLLNEDQPDCNIGKLIKQARKKLGITQQRLADITGMSLSNIKKYEQDGRVPKLDKIIKISKALNLNNRELLPLEELVGLDRIKNSKNYFIIFLKYLGFEIYELENKKGFYMDIKTGRNEQFYIDPDNIHRLENIFSSIIQNIVPVIAKQISNEEFTKVSERGEMNQEQCEAFLKLLASKDY